LILTVKVSLFNILCLDIKPGDVLAEEIKAIDDLPPFRASVMVQPFNINIITRMVMQLKVNMRKKVVY
jgi:hypothetical protein